MLSVALFNKIFNVICINYMYCINQKSIITLFIRECRKINDHIKFQPYNLHVLNPLPLALLKLFEKR